jgi:hypothetical protein
MRFQTLGALIGMDRIRQQAWDETCDLTERHDVPSGEHVPEDLRDKMGFFWHTRNGYRVSGRMLPSDMLQGSPSAAMPLILVLFSLLAPMTIGLGFVFGSWMWAIIATPLLLAYLVLMHKLFASGITFVMLLALTMSIGHNFLPFGMIGSFVGIFAQLTLVFAPRWYARRVANDRAHKLAVRGSQVLQAETGLLARTHIGPRRLQLENALRDNSPFICLGTASGTFHHFMDGYAPDPGLPFGLTCEDLSTHFVVFGKTGTGKTSGILRPISRAFLDSGFGGALILDGKGQLASEFVEYESYLLVEPGRCDLALLEGLEPEEVVQTIAAINQKAGDGEGTFFVNSGRQLLLYAAVVLREMSKCDSQAFPWSFGSLVLMLDRMTTLENSKQYTSFLAARTQGNDLLKDAIRYFEVKMPQMDERTRSNVVSTCEAWLAPVMSHPKVRPWANLTTGVDVTVCLRGGLIGINAPAAEYGDAGRVITALVKARVFASVRRRMADWKQNGVDKPILMLVDEAQAVIGRSEQEIFPVARSLGLMGVYATQSVDEFYDCFGEPGTLALLNNFRSFAVFDSSENTFEWASRHLGTSEVRTPKFKGMMADPCLAATLAAGSPIFDPAHPDRRYMRALARDDVGGLWSVVKKAVALFRGGAEGINLDYETEYSASVERLLTAERADAFLATPKVAIIQVQRAGVRRRDVVRLNPIF